MLFLSKYILDNKQYDTVKKFDGIQVRWSTSKLRQWLGFENSFITYVDTNGKINKSGCANNSCTVGVRPAMWIKYK